MLNFLKLIPMIIKYLPLVITVVTTIEHLTDPATSGEDKKALALKTLKDMLSTFGVTPSDDVMSVLSSVIDVVVGVLHVLGIFIHKAEADPSDPSAVAAQAVTTIPVTPAQAALKAASAKADAQIATFTKAHPEFAPK